MKIANKKVEVPQDNTLNDKDYLNRVLLYLKELEKNYAVVLTEASNDKLYNLYLDHFEKISKLQRQIYTVMFRNGWYELETADISKIKTKYNTIYKDYNAL